MRWAFATVERLTGIDRSGQVTAYWVAFGHGGTHWIMGTLYILVPFLSEELGLSYAEAGAVFSAMAIASFAVNIGSGAIVDLTGRRVVVLGFGLAGCAMAMLGIGLVPSLLGLTVGAIIIGGANNLWHPAAFSFLSGRFPNNRGFAISVHGMGANIGDAVGPLAAGALMMWLGWQSAAIVNGLPMLFFAVLIVVFINRDESGGTEEPSQSADLSNYFRGIWALFKQRAVFGVCLLAGLRTMTQNGIYVFLPFYLKDVMGMEAALIGLVWAIMQIGGMISGPVAGTWSDTIGRRPLVIAGLIATAATLFVLNIFENQAVFVAFIAFLGFSLFAVRPVVHAWMMDLAPAHLRGGATNLVFGSQSALRMLIPLVGGVMADSWGLGSVFYLLVGISILGAMTAGFLPKNQTLAN